MSRWVLPRVLAGALGVAYLTSIGVLLTYAAVPMLFGWSTYVVESESMAPAVRAGDALVTAPADDRKLERGRIVVVQDPAVAGRLLSHRIVDVRPDGSLVTRGDANRNADSTPVPAADVRGLARLRVPFVGLPVQWARAGEVTRLSAWLALTAAAVAAAATDPSRRPAKRRRPPWSWRRPGRRRVPPGVPLAATCLALAVATTSATSPERPPRAVHAVFTATTVNGSNELAASPDFIPPDAAAVVVSKEPAGFLTGVVRSSGAYRVYAQVSDTGNPASGAASVTADMSAVTAGATAAALSSGAVTLAGVSYSHRSGSLTAGAGSGTKGYTLSMTDAEGNSRTRTGYSVTYDNTVPTATGVAAADKVGGTAGRPEQGDTITLTYSERIDPYSILAGWTGAAQSMRVVIAKSGNSSTVTFQTVGGAAQLPLGQIAISGTYTNGTMVFTGSTMTQSAGTITVVLGSNADAPSTNGAADMTWTPNATAVDAGGNPVSTAGVTENDNDIDF